MKSVICLLLSILLFTPVLADTTVLEYTGECPHEVFDFEWLLPEEQEIVTRMGWEPEGYTTGMCEICDERFLLHPYQADYSNIHVMREECPHHFKKLPAVIEEGWYTVGAVGHQYKTYHLAVCALCPAYIKYYTRPGGGTATADMVKPHDWTEIGKYSYHDAENNQHIYIDICADCGMATSGDMTCCMYDNGLCMYELQEALAFYGKGW